MGVAAAPGWVPPPIHHCAWCSCSPCPGLSVPAVLAKCLKRCWGKEHAVPWAPSGAELVFPPGGFHGQSGWERVVVVAVGSGGGTWREQMPLPGWV